MKTIGRRCYFEGEDGVGEEPGKEVKLVGQYEEALEKTIKELVRNNNARNMVF